ncbi:probable ATP-dependent RNA helicase DDX58 isoform X2 [Acanthaster planci]|uniref:RNA helicase n=1 Tax=Acanthaster planci TaxID=133434 RepID=A0A8B7ZE20_ACAPL|nr:probable ATP-dependent RNA helicase DDX58 isoform X2 [Acanthaster planci]
MMAALNQQKFKGSGDPSSANNGLLTVVFRAPLLNHLSIDSGFLGALVQSCLISVDEQESILRKESREDRIRFLLRIIWFNPSDVVSQFISALKQSDGDTNRLLADHIEGVRNIPQYDRERGLIKKHYQRLAQDIDPSGMIPHLTYIHIDDRERIMATYANGHLDLARCALLHLTLRTLAPEWFNEFLTALENTGQGNVARQMRVDFQNEEENAMETQALRATTEARFSEETSLGLAALSLEDYRCPDRHRPMEQRVSGEGMSGMQYPSHQQPERRSQSMGPPTSTSRTRSRSEKRSRPASSRESSRSPKRRRTYQEKMVLFKRNRGRPNFGPVYNNTVIQQNVQNIYNNTTNNKVNIVNSQNVRAMVGGERNTMNIGEQRCRPDQMPDGEADLQQDDRCRGDDEPDHAKVPRHEDVRDVYRTPMSNVDDTPPGMGKSSMEGIEIKRPNLYEDQLELAENAVAGKNTVLVAPTGSGKTHVAAYIIHDHFIANLPKPVNKRRALFLVNTVNLVGQQQEKLKEVLEPTSFFSVIGIHGASELSLKEEVASRNVIVLTAQLLENAVKEISLEEFSLLVFDECHLCQKGHAYNTIMARYLDEKRQGKTNLPQIIGMTASLGTGKAKTQDDADNHAVQICANMGAECISMVIRNVAVLELRVNIPQEVEPIEIKCREKDPFAEKINQIMEKIEKMLNESSSLDVQKFIRSACIPSQRGSQAYRQWCDRMKRSAQIFIKNGQDAVYRMLQTCITHLMEYNKSLVINKQVRTVDAFEYLHRMKDAMNDRSSCFDETDLQLFKLFIDEERALMEVSEDPTNQNPLLEKLSEIIQEEYRIRPESRAILFVKTIDTTEALHDWLTQTPELEFLTPGRIAGSRDMNSIQQNKVIEQFRSGEHKMLVATNLLEQGTDVPACNLVIRLDYVPSDFGHVQIKGRTRAKDGRSYLITLVESKGVIRDSANRQREIMMKEAAQNLMAKTPGQFVCAMERQQDKDRLERQARQEQKRDIRQDNQGETFAFCCINCSMVAFHSYHVGIYVESQFLILDPDFAGRMEIKEHPKPKKVGKDVTVVGKMFCKRCGHDWGALTRIQDSYYPSVRICRFSLKNVSTGEPHTYKKWKEAPFEVEKVAKLPPEAKVKVPTSVLKKLRKL